MGVASCGVLPAPCAPRLLRRASDTIDVNLVRLDPCLRSTERGRGMHARRRRSAGWRMTGAVIIPGRSREAGPARRKIGRVATRGFLRAQGWGMRGELDP